MTKKDKSYISSKLLVLIKVSSLCGKPLTLEEILQLMDKEITKEDLVTIIKEKVKEGIFEYIKSFIVYKGFKRIVPYAERRYEESKVLQSYGKRLASLLGSVINLTKTLAICGSVASDSASYGDDVDFFIITKPKRLWIFLLIALLKARIMKIKLKLHGKDIVFCFSYVLDERLCVKNFSYDMGPLFARDALTVKIIKGKSYYSYLIKNNFWLYRYFPRLYESISQLHEANDYSKIVCNDDNSLALDLLNFIVYPFVKSYLKLFAYIRNLRFKKLRKPGRIFKPIITIDSCVYESNRYKELERIYRSIKW